MENNFQITAIKSTQIADFFNMEPQALAKLGAVKMKVDSNPGFPCRVSLKDAAVGEEVILLPFQHHQTTSPYQATGPIFVRKKAATATLKVNEIPSFLNHRFLSLRGYDKHGMMIDAQTTEGRSLETAIARLLSNPAIEYLQIHNASYGCYMCQVNRTPTTINPFSKPSQDYLLLL